MWKEYQKEKYGRETIESADGFLTYNVHTDGSVYIYQLYVTEEARDKGEGQRLEQILIKKEQPAVIFCDIDMESNGWEKALIQIVTKADYKYDSTIGGRIILFKDLR